MKSYALISLIIFCGFGCRSSSNMLDTSLRVEQTETKKKDEIKVERQNSLLVEAKKTDLDMQVDEDITLITYDPLSGNILSVKNTKRSTAKKEKTNSSVEENNDKQSYNKQITDTHSKTNIEAVEHRESKGDSRPVQGWKEWGIITLVVFLIIGVVILIIWQQKKKR